VKLQLSLTHFNELSARQLYAIYKLRSEVFVVEQNCAYQDVDDKDLHAWHLMLCKNNELVGYCRLLPPGLSYSESSIGRVVTVQSERGQGTGRQLMEEAIRHTFALFGKNDILISAQTYLIKFYKSLGFVEEGEVYPEDDIPHIKMRLSVL